MFKWAKQAMANVVGTEEPIYGPEAIKTVRQEAAETVPYTEITRDDLKMQGRHTTSVETLVFYLMSEDGKHYALVQLIYSNVAGLHTTCQFNSKIFYLDGSKPHLWCSTPLQNHEFTEDKTGFYAKDLAIDLSEDGTSYTIKSLNDERSIVNVTITRTAPGFQAGKTGRTLYGTDLAHPWGEMRHAFWPRALGTGTITTKDGPIEFKGRAMFAYAIQGMKPHHAAGKWNFVNFQGPTYSAVLMEFTTPPSYGSTVVTVGGIAKDGEIIVADSAKAAHVKTEVDEIGWPVPESAKFEWEGKTKDGKAVDGLLEGDLGKKLDRIDVMAEVPGFIKKIAETAAGTKPYIYQYAPKLSLKLKIGDEEVTEQGEMFSEATFITAC